MVLGYEHNLATEKLSESKAIIGAVCDAQHRLPYDAIIQAKPDGRGRFIEDRRSISELFM